MAGRGAAGPSESSTSPLYHPRGAILSDTGVFEQTGRAVLQEAAQPLADGGNGGSEEPRYLARSASPFASFDVHTSNRLGGYDVITNLVIFQDLSTT